MPDYSTTTPPNDLLQQIALEYLKEGKRKRRWGIFYKALFLLLILVCVVGLFFASDDEEVRDRPHVALIDIRGVMDDDGLSKADNIAQSLSMAYRDKGTKAIILRINSPGGSPVQADDIYREIMRYRGLHPKIKIYAVCTDMCASAAYYAASAANEIYANPASIVGSIGVIYNGFGFNNLMQKVGVTRRLVTAGQYKGFMDPFSPEQPKEKEMLHHMLEIVHQQFEDRVKQGRGDRLHITPDLFSGLFWTGTQAKELGLIDGFGSAGSVAREVIKVKHIVDYTMSESSIDKFARQLGIGATTELVNMPQSMAMLSS
jgi:protease-4